MKHGKDLRGLAVGLCLLAAGACVILFGSGGGKTLPEPLREETAGPGAVRAENGEYPGRENPGGENEDSVAVLPSGEKTEEAPRKPGPGPYVAIVIDDFGFSKAITDGYGELTLPLTWSIIPFQSHSLYAAGQAEKAGIPYMIHMPMGAGGDKKWDEKTGVIDSGMSAETVTLLLRKALVFLPGALGMNNHRGSRATRDEHLMETVMTELASTSLFFLDSRTSSASVAYNTARTKGIPAAFCSVFLDHEPAEEFMEKQFQRGLDLAAKRGWVVMIAHTRQGTLDFLKKKSDSPPEKVTFVTMPELMHILWDRSDMSSRQSVSGRNVFKAGRRFRAANEGDFS